MADGLFTLACLVLTIKRVVLTVDSELTSSRFQAQSFQLPCSMKSSKSLAKLCLILTSLDVLAKQQPLQLVRLWLMANNNVSFSNYLMKQAD